jgi:hypothetical protein
MCLLEQSHFRTRIGLKSPPKTRRFTATLPLTGKQEAENQRASTVRLILRIALGSNRLMATLVRTRFE